jgi:hypothetical protein
VDGVGLRGGSGMFVHFFAESVVLMVSRLFIIDGVISLPIAIAGFFVLPDVPEISNPWYLTEKVSSLTIQNYDNAV